jgi:hypothetical protein
VLDALLWAEEEELLDDPAGGGGSGADEVELVELVLTLLVLELTDEAEL